MERWLVTILKVIRKAPVPSRQTVPHRKYGIPLTGIWVRERHRSKRTRQQSEVVHSHLLLHLPVRYRAAAREDVDRLVTLMARQILGDRTIELTFPSNTDGKDLLKGGTQAVWKAFGLPT